MILGYRFWQNRLGSDPDIVGKTLTLDGVPHVVVGIAPDQFGGHLGLQGGTLFVPLERHPRLRGWQQRRATTFVPTGRRSGCTSTAVCRPASAFAQASAAVSAVTSRLAKQYPATNEFKAGIAEAYDPLGNLERSQFRILQAVALTLTGMVLLVVCLNISGMMQVRSAMRERELSIRQAIGASRATAGCNIFCPKRSSWRALGGALASLVLFNIPSLVSWWLDRQSDTGSTAGGAAGRSLHASRSVSGSAS